VPLKLNIVIGIAAGVAMGLLLDRSLPGRAEERV
jgi:hypothetical protein